MSKHTPGPWDAHSDGYITEPGGCVIATTMLFYGEGGLNNICAIRDANARLIAAAPDLLASLKWAIAEMQGDSGTGDSYWTTSPHYRAALAAVHKAEAHP